MDAEEREAFNALISEKYAQQLRALRAEKIVRALRQAQPGNKAESAAAIAGYFLEEQAARKKDAYAFQAERNGMRNEIARLEVRATNAEFCLREALAHNQRLIENLNHTISTQSGIERQKQAAVESAYVGGNWVLECANSQCPGKGTQHVYNAMGAAERAGWRHVCGGGWFCPLCSGVKSAGEENTLSAMKNYHAKMEARKEKEKAAQAGSPTKIEGLLRFECLCGHVHHYLNEETARVFGWGYTQSGRGLSCPRCVERANQEALHRARQESAQQEREKDILNSRLRWGKHHTQSQPPYVQPPDAPMWEGAAGGVPHKRAPAAEEKAERLEIKCVNCNYVGEFENAGAAYIALWSSRGPLENPESWRCPKCTRGEGPGPFPESTEDKRNNQEQRL